MSQTDPIQKLRYPIGRMKYEPGYDEQIRAAFLRSIRTLPERLRALIEHRDDSRLDRPYRPGGWTARQVIHHIADSHLNSFVRFKWALTEETPTIKTYNENAWAQLPDYQKTPVSVSLDLIEALHARWLILLESLEEKDWQRAVFHPEAQREIKLEEFLALYGWHCDHHLAHIRLALKS